MKLILNFIFGLYCLGRLVSMVPLHRAPMEDTPANTVVKPVATPTGTAAVATSKGSNESAFNLFNYAEIIGVVILFFSMAMRKKRTNVVVQDPTNPTVVDTTPI